MERLKNKRRIYKCKRKFRVRHLTLTWEYCTMQKTNMKYKFLFVTVGTALATAACGGYIIIATGLLIAAATGELVGRKTVIPSFTHFRFFDRSLRRKIPRALHELLCTLDNYARPCLFPNSRIVSAPQGILSLLRDVSFGDDDFIAHQCSLRRTHLQI